MKKKPDTSHQPPDTYQRRQSGSQPDGPVHWPRATGHSLFAQLWAYSLRLIAGKGEDAFAKVWLGFLEGLSRLYGATVNLRANLRLSSPRRLPCPVISIGNIAVGGTGKTSFVEMLAKRLLDQGMKPLVLLRGYRGRAKVPLVVSDGVDILARPPLAGDEAYLLATKLPGVPVVTGADRYLAGSLALSHFHPHVFLLDDGFQHRKLHRDLDIVLLDGRNPFGYGYLLPRGLLREPPEALKRAHLVAITTDLQAGEPQDLQPLRNLLRRYHPKAPIILRRLPRAFLALSEGREVRLSALKGKKALAFSGIGNPASFEAQLRHLGVEVLEHRVFLDHHRYRPEDLVALAEAAERRDAEVLLTTEKDMVKMPFWPYAIPLFALRIELEVIEGEKELEQVLESVIGGQ